jgi:DNA-binding protein YbaB
VSAMSFDAMAHVFDETMGRARSRSAAFGQAADELAGQLGRARSGDGDAEAVVDGRGALVSLWLAESVTRMSPEAVGALIVATAGAAATDVLRRRRQVLDDLVADLGR